MGWTARVWGASGVVALGAGGLWFWAMPHDSVRVPVPGPDSSPTQVVRTYVRALDARDYSTSNAIQMLGPAVENHGLTGGPKITHLKIIRATPVTAGAAFPDSRLTSWKQVAEVDTQADFHDWGGMQDGPNGWSYYLVRNTDSQRWRIADWGQG